MADLITQCEQGRLVFTIDPLPDFLADHTLAGTTPTERLREIVTRWVQWVSALWIWRDQCLFALRFVADRGRIAITIEVVASRDILPRLRSEIGVLIRSHRLGNGVPELIDPAQDMPTSNVACVEVCQHLTRSLWAPHANLSKNDAFRREYAWLPESDVITPPVIYPWWAPGGSFLMPMECLLSQPVRCQLLVLLQPTELSHQEFSWLAVMSREAQSKGEQNIHAFGAGASMRSADPAATLAGRLYMANLRRLSSAPFLATTLCIADQGRRDVARSLANSIQSLVHEAPFDRPQQDDDRLPSGADLHDPADKVEPHLQWLSQAIFPSGGATGPLARLPYLVDARGAAMTFRLPVSVRGGVPGVNVRQLSPDFHPGPRRSKPPVGHIHLGSFEAGGLATIPLRDLTKHTLITGFTGSGKTVTALNILHQLWNDHRVPFLVLESAKQEYRGLLTVPAFENALRVYTVGNELGAPLRLNPFELLPGVRVESHVSKLQTCFEAAIPPIGPSASVIAEAMLRVYEACGWGLTDVCPMHRQPKRSFPTLTAFVDTVEAVLESRGYAGEVSSNLRAALVGRFRPLLLGSKGRTFDSQLTYPRHHELFNLPVVLELNDLNVDDKALVVMFLLTILREYRERHKSNSGELLHVTFVEEAHNVLENVASKGSQEGSSTADTRFKAVETFCQLLTEVRALGEGIIIADQSPQKLARDALRNTNLQIAHQLRDDDDRRAMSSAMIMEKEQEDYLGKLSPGQAALFFTGLEKATFVRVDPFTSGAPAPDSANVARPIRRGDGFRADLTDDELVAIMLERDPALSSYRRAALPFDGCALCRRPCEFRDPIFPAVATESFVDAFRNWQVRSYENADRDAETTSRELVTLGLETLRAARIPPSMDAAWCWLLHAFHGRGPTAFENRPAFDHSFRERFAGYFQNMVAARHDENRQSQPVLVANDQT